MLKSIAPFFIVDDLKTSIDFYCSRLGFKLTYTGGGDGISEDYFGIVQRDSVMLLLKAISPEIHPEPNHSRHEWARWDAYHYVPDPDALAVEFASRGVMFSEALKDTEDNLRGFEVKDPDGYVLFFGRPRS